MAHNLYLLRNGRTCYFARAQSRSGLQGMELSQRMQNWKIVLIAWILLILVLCTFPWWVAAPQWGRVRWIPLLDVLRSPHRLLRDAVANCFLYIPLGFAYAKVRPAAGVKRLCGAAMLGLLLSLAAELYQVFSPVRVPTMTDVLMNTVGALIGASLAASRSGKSDAKS